MTDAQGRFTFKPLPPGYYQVHADQQNVEGMDLTQGILSASAPLIEAEWLELKPGFKPYPIELHEVDAVILEVRQVDLRGNPVRGNPIVVRGHILHEEPEPDLPPELPAEVFDDLPVEEFSDGPLPDQTAYWGVRALPDVTGRLRIRVPRGLCNLRIETSPRPGTKIAVRMTGDGPLEPIDKCNDLHLKEDHHVISLVQFRPPLLKLRLETDEGPVREGYQIEIRQGGQVVARRSDILRNEDGRDVLDLLFPDQKSTIKAIIPGFDPAEAVVTMSEGEVKELTIKLKSRPRND